ncbi:hypothetical protein PTTG_30292, partial [Puccinia triticina 1-1 BBBD Race 1]|uniref:Retrovirus-related Pol polyprotein from transposon TNT 1-94-like beta-barrel domain-containing protein n=2 Tax=Puccinia triticina (isolate 1-1 / race 1 (BBBD)) TaxID=630390 RepID=A0ABL7D6E4_PUCT1
MVNTRRERPELTGPLPPPTRAKRPKQTKSYKALLKLPPLPPSPIEEKPDPLEHDRPLSPFISAISYIVSKSLTRQIDELKSTTITFPNDSRVVRNPFGLPITTVIPSPEYRPKVNIPRDTTPILSPQSPDFPQSPQSSLGPISATSQTPFVVDPPTIPMSQANTTDISPRNKFLQQPSIYKSEVDPLLPDGLNFNKWKRGLTRIVLLTLGHPNFFDKVENYIKLSAQENTCLLYLIQITVHDELSSLVDRFTTGTEAYEAVQTNFQGTIRFRQMELMDKLLELRISGPSTDPSQIPGLFNKLFDIFSDLQKVGAALSPLVESLILQSIVPPPASMSWSQLFQNISLQLGQKADVTARDIQTIITSAYGETVRFDSSTLSIPSVYRTWPNQPPANIPNWNAATQPNARIQQPARSQRQPTQQRPSVPQPNQQRNQNVGTPGNPTIDDIASAINNIRRGNTGPNDPNLLAGRPCLYCGVSGHWRSTCPTLRRDAGLQLPNTPAPGCPASGFARQAAPPNDPPTRPKENAAVQLAVGADATGTAGVGTVLDSGATHHVSGSLPDFSFLTALRPSMRLNLASSTGFMTATHSGHLRITNGAGTLEIPKVLYSPEMTGTLLSLGQLIDS